MEESDGFDACRVTVLHIVSDDVLVDEGGTPTAGLIQAPDGTIYGTTRLGGPARAGTVFKPTTDGSLSTLHTFGNANRSAACP
jgi:uncharacterized repeat protein (TIGR03803 family)